MTQREIAKFRLLSEVFKNVSDEDKRMLLTLAKSDDEIMNKLNVIQMQMDKNKYSFGVDLLANVTGNAIFDGAVFIISKLLQKVKP